MRIISALFAALVLASVGQACPPSFSLNSYAVQQSNACYSAPVQQFQAYVAPAQVQSYAVQSYVQPVQRVFVQKQFAVQSYVQPVQIRQKVFVQKQFAVQSYGVQQFAAPQVIQQSTVERKGLFGLRKNKTTTTTIINP